VISEYNVFSIKDLRRQRDNYDKILGAGVPLSQWSAFVSSRCQSFLFLPESYANTLTAGGCLRPHQIYRFNR
jgi:hypothetical protein